MKQPVQFIDRHLAEVAKFAGVKYRSLPPLSRLYVDGLCARQHRLVLQKLLNVFHGLPVR